MMPIRSPRKHVPRKPRKERSTAMTIAIMSVLALATVGLSGVALFSQYEGDASTGAGARVSTEATEAASGEPAPARDTTRPEDSAEAQSGTAIRSDRMLALSDDAERLLRAQGTECAAGESALETSNDGGLTWMQADTSMLEITSVRQLQFGESGRAQLAFTDQQCSLQFARSYVYGAAWEAGAGAAGVWSLGEDEEVPALVVSGEEVEAPCPVVATSGTDSSGIVLCDDGTVTVSDDAGQSWGDPITVPSAEALAVTADEKLIVSLNEDGCSGITVRSLNGNDLKGPSSCEEVDAKVGEVAIAASGTTLVVWAGEELLRSGDYGDTWS